MDSELEKNLEDTHSLIVKSFPEVNVDSLDVVKQVEEYRQFWKPKEVDVVLLAESHVYTDNRDFETKLNREIFSGLLPAYPLRLVRFVYCLGYGEPLLQKNPRTDQKTRGTSQYWKIFSSCVGEDDSRVLRKGTKGHPSQRIRNKINVLRKMKEDGIWLMDASIVGVNRIKKPKVRSKIIQICWDNFLQEQIQEARPNRVIVIKYSSMNPFIPELKKFKIPLKLMPQPRGQPQMYYQHFGKLVKNSIWDNKTTDFFKTKTAGSINLFKKKRFSWTKTRLIGAGYQKIGKKEWKNDNKIVHIVESSDFGEKMRVTWKEKWKNDHAIIFDYSKANGPVCIVPISVLFNQSFVREKRKTEAYANSGYWWTQSFQNKHKLAKLLISFGDQWSNL
jgi:hypothetical protein